MMAWILSTRIGRGIAAALAIIAFALAFYWRAFTAGKRTERAAQDQQSLRNMKTRQETHDAIATRPSDQRRDDLRRWVQPD